jgi:hypothetical protein
MIGRFLAGLRGVGFRVGFFFRFFAIVGITP